METAVKPLMGLLLVALAVGLVARLLRFPYTLALVVAGLGIGLLDIATLKQIHLTPGLLFVLLLPPLLFEASFHLEWDRLRRDARLIGLLAGPGVAVATGLGAACLYGLSRAAGVALSAADALIFAAITSPTDPVSVLALFRTAGVDRRLHVVIEAESLLNDGVGVVVFLIVAGALGIDVGHGVPAVSTTGDALLFGLRTLLWMAGVGVGTGALLGLAAGAVHRVIDDHLAEVALTAILAWGSFVLADSFQASGVLACVTAGIVHGNLAGRTMSPTTRGAVIDFWEFMAFLANTLVFLLIGLELDAVHLAAAALPVALAWVSVLVARLFVLGLGWGGTRLRGGVPMPPTWAAVAWWGGGLRGSLSMVLVMGLPTTLSSRPTLLTLVFGVTAVTLLVQGTTVAPLLSYLGVGGPRIPAELERAHVRRRMAVRALDELDRLVADGRIGASSSAALRADYERRRAEAEADVQRQDVHAIAADQRRAARLLLAVERDVLREAQREGTVSAPIAAGIQDELALRREKLEES